jgi:CheY-like chemotaxis protein
LPVHLPILQGMRILVLEDEDDTRNLLGVVLESHGACAILTSNVSQALEDIRTVQPIDVVVADIGMPDYNGYAFIASLRKEQQPQIRNTPVIALTAYATAADRDTALSSGFNEYLNKPFEPGELTATIKRLHDEHHRNAGV